MAPILSNLHYKENSDPSLYDHSIDYRLDFQPAECSYIEILPNPTGTSTIREGWLYSNQIEGWLFSNLHSPYYADVHHAQLAQQGLPKGGLRLLLSTSKTSNADKTVIMPWSQTTFEQICQKLSAPQHIIDVLTEKIPHVAHLPVEFSVGGEDVVVSDGMCKFLSPNTNEVTESSLSVQSGHRHHGILYGSFNLSQEHSNDLWYCLSTE